MTPEQQKQIVAARRVHDAVHRVNALIRLATDVGLQFEHVNCDGDPEFLWTPGQTKSGTLDMMREEFVRGVQP